jgi:branched-chain amino acid transport system permease protein
VPRSDRVVWRRPGARRWISDVTIVLLPCVVFLVLLSTYSNELLLVNLLAYAILAQGINIIYGFTGYLPFGYVGFFGAGAYGTALAVIHLGVGAWPAVALGGCAGAALALLLSPLLRLSGAYFAIASLAASEAVYYVISNPSLTKVTNGPYGINLASIYNPTQSYWALVLTLGAALAAVVFLRRSRFGLALRAIRSNPLSAEVAGVHVVRDRALAWVVSGLLAGLAGGAFAWAISVFYPETVFDLSISIFAIVFAMFGGMGTAWGPLFGTVLLYGLYNYIGVSQPQYFQLIYGLLIIALVLFVPDGVRALIRLPRGKRQRRPVLAKQDLEVKSAD